MSAEYIFYALNDSQRPAGPVLVSRPDLTICSFFCVFSSGSHPFRETRGKPGVGARVFGNYTNARQGKKEAGQISAATRVVIFGRI
jgi:hypothetical protein